MPSPSVCRNAPRSSPPAPSRRERRSSMARARSSSPIRRSRPQRWGAPRGSGRQRRTRRRPGSRPCGAERCAEAGHRHRRLRARPRGDQSPGASRARSRGPAQPAPVLAVRTAGLRADGAQGFRRLVGEAGSGAFVVRARGVGSPTGRDVSAALGSGAAGSHRRGQRHQRPHRPKGAAPPGVRGRARNGRRGGATSRFA